MEKTEDEPKKGMNPQQEQIHDVIFSKEIGWQEIIYDLINSEQLDPWNIDIIVLTNNYLRRLQKYEEENYFISSKVLLAASLLLRIKSEILLNKYIKSIDEILFGKKEKIQKSQERIYLDEEIPFLVPKSPIPRFRKVSLKELMESLGKAINTENKRIRKEITQSNALREISFSMPKRKYRISDKIKEIYSKLSKHFGENQEKSKVAYTEFIGNNKDEKILAFLPLLHLEDQKKIWLEQEDHFEEIQIWLKKIYLKHNPDPFADLREEIAKEMEILFKKEFPKKMTSKGSNNYKQ